jgi:hypothetical protein
MCDSCHPRLRPFRKLTSMLCAPGRIMRVRQRSFTFASSLHTGSRHILYLSGIYPNSFILRPRTGSLSPLRLSRTGFPSSKCKFTNGRTLLSLKTGCFTPSRSGIPLNSVLPHAARKTSIGGDTYRSGCHRLVSQIL